MATARHVHHLTTATMARKKAASKSNASSGESTQRASAEDGGGDGAATAAAATTTSVPVEDLTLEQLRSELQSARSELAVLRAQLGASAPATPPDVQALSDRLAALRREQEEADAARDKAWQQLKSVVQEISGLANPDYLQSLVVQPHDKEAGVKQSFLALAN